MKVGEVGYVPKGQLMLNRLYAQNPLNELNRPFSRVDKGIDTYY
jgi:hypothetical protein